MAKRRTKAGAQQGLEDAPLMPTGALAVALLAFAEGPGPVVHVARDARRLEDLAATLRALEPDARVAVYPEWDCLPFDHASPSRATMGARAAVMRWLTDRDALPDFVLTTAPALVQRVPPPETWASARVTLRVGDPSTSRPPPPTSSASATSSTSGSTSRARSPSAGAPWRCSPPPRRGRAGSSTRRAASPRSAPTTRSRSARWRRPTNSSLIRPPRSSWSPVPARAPSRSPGRSTAWTATTRAS